MRFFPRASRSVKHVLVLACLLPALSASGCRNPGAGASGAFVPGLTPSAENCPAGDRVETILSGGQTRTYRVHVPAAATDGRPAAMVLGFHGNMGAAEGFESYSGLSELADREGFLAVYPQGAGEIPTWEVDAVAHNADVEFVRGLIAELEQRCAVDPGRIYATGFSRGGGMAHRLACDLADRIAAIGPVSGFYPPGGACDPARPVAVIAFHGTADPDVPYNGIGDPGGPPAAYFAIGVPIPQWASAWAERDGCASGPDTIAGKADLFGSSWSGCRGSTEVILYTIPGGGHEWPGGDIDAARMIWEFFKSRPLGS
jgi:polyhydroxybutyrate depolymerase